jgi:hypothetical protein
MRFRTAVVVALASVAGPLTLAAQTASSPAPTLDFSGVMFGNFQIRSDSAAKAQTGGKQPNRFDLARVYLNFRMPAGERGSIRATTDLYQNTLDGYYTGWALRFKYAYFQYNATSKLAGVDGLSMVARVGMLHNVVVEHMDSYWPRWMSQNAVETHGFFASADMGVASLVTLPKRRGEAYFTIVNGNGYTAAETDRFKDIGARFSWTPFANDSGFLRTFAITPWYSRGRTAGIFSNGGAGQVGPWTKGVQRDRRGLFAGLRDRRLTSGAEFSQRVEGLEAGANTAGNPRTVRNRTSNLTSAFAIVRPLEVMDASKRSRLSLFTRFDAFQLDDPPVTAPQPKVSTSLVWFGLFWDLNARSTFTIDFQTSTTKTTPAGSTTTNSVPTKTLFFHWVANY